LMELLRHGVETPENWRKSYELIWDEFMDMHSLFETSTPAFNYMTPQTHLVLKYFENLWASKGDGPWVTMDAGANVHVLYRADQSALAQQVREHWGKELKVFSSEPKP
jgi:diphosphomevalonate decarboxylase